MQATHIDNDTFIRTLEESQILATLDGPGAGQTYIATQEGGDIIIVTDAIKR